MLIYVAHKVRYIMTVVLNSQRSVSVPDDAADCCDGDLACGPRDDRPRRGHA